jgi:hypothetical protein
MNRLITLVFCIFLLPQLQAQYSITYKANGAISKLKIDTPDTKCWPPFIFGKPAPPARTITLPTDDKTAAIKTIREKCQKAADLLDPASEMYPFYAEIWNAPDIVNLKSWLSGIALGNNLPAPALYKNIQVKIDNLAPIAVYNTTATGDGATVDLGFTNVVNKMLLDYYNEVIDQTGNAEVKGLSLNRYAAIADYIKAIYSNKAQALAQARNLMSETNRQQMEAGIKFKDDPMYKKAKELLGKDWFKQWLWYTEGNVRWNPFEFANDNFFKKYPQSAGPKEALRIQYADSLLQRYIRNDSTQRIADVDKLLAITQDNRMETSYLQRIDKIKEESQEQLKKILTVEELKNRTLFPIENGKMRPHFYYSKDKKISGRYKTGEETESIPNTNTKTIVVHNVPKGSEVFVRESSAPFEDKAAFTVFIEQYAPTATSLVSGLVGVAGNVTGALAGLQSSTRVVHDIQRTGNKRAPDSGIVLKEFPLQLVITDEELSNRKSIVQQYLEEKDLFNKNLFENLMARRSLMTKSSEEIIEIYTEKYASAYQQLIFNVAADSVILSYFNNAFFNSTPPPPSVSAEPVGDPAFFTHIDQTEVYQKAVTNTVRVVAVGKTDSAEIKSFSYNIGKRHRFQLTAGLSYSTPAPVNNELTEQDGKPVVTQKKDQVDVMAGINFHLFQKGIFLQNNSAKPSWDRLSVFLGVSVTDALNNFYTGLAYDIVPAVKVLGGAHFHNVTEYTLKNNQVASQSSAYKPSFFIGIGFDPVTLIATLNIFK